MIVQTITYGIDQLRSESAAYKGKRIALVCNRASVTIDGVPSRVALLKSGFAITKLFSPEHGLDATGTDGHYQSDGIDHVTGLPVTSLYGDSLAPRQEDLAGIDIVIFDLPDVGCRFYTYLWTMTHVMEACAAFNIPLIITDRPNPIGGNFRDVEGPMLDETSCSSFIGRWSIPVRHSCTLGELAQYFKVTRMPDLRMTIIPVANWKREQPGGYNFTAPSPAIKDIATAFLYAGTGLLEGINVNEGRGTAIPFKVCAAPWINKGDLLYSFEENMNPGIHSCTGSYIARDELYTGERCYGLLFSITDEKAFRPVQTAISLIATIIKLYPGHVEERNYNTLANRGGKAHLDKLLGIPVAFDRIKNGGKIVTNVQEEWAAIMQQFLLYP